MKTIKLTTKELRYLERLLVTEYGKTSRDIYYKIVEAIATK